jgi:glutamine synthetase
MALCREKGVQCVEVRYMCLDGSIEYFHIPAERLSEELFEVGLPFVSDRRHCYASAHAALVPLADTSYLAPFRAQTTLVLLAEMQDAVTRRDDDFDPRGILRRAHEAWMSTGICDKVLLGQTCEVLLLRSLECKQADRSSELRFETLSSAIGTSVRFDYQKLDSAKSDFSDSTSKTWPDDAYVNDLAAYCGEVLQHLSLAGIEIEYANNSGTNLGHCRFQLAPVDVVKAADIHLQACDIIRSTAAKFGLTACFLPAISKREPLLGWDLRLNLLKSGESLVTGTKHFGLSDKGLAIAAGLVTHLGACMAFTSRSELSYVRLHRLRRIRVKAREHQLHPFINVVASTSQLTDRTLELGFCDQTSNPYLAIASVLMAALHGLEENMTLDEVGNLVSSRLDRGGKSSHRMPATIERALARTASDQDFLLAHDVFSTDVLRAWRRHLLKEKTLASSDLSLPGEFLARYRG